MSRSNVELQKVAREDKSVLRNLMELYLYDFSEYLGEDVDCDGPAQEFNSPGVTP